MHQCGKTVNFFNEDFEFLTLTGHIRDCLHTTVG